MVLRWVPLRSGGEGSWSAVLHAQWWAWIAQPGVVVKSISTWRSGLYTHRDPTLNRLLRVRFMLLGDWPLMHLKRGTHVLYLSVPRLRVGAPWRLLETVAAPQNG